MTSVRPAIKFLSSFVLTLYDGIVDATCKAWSRLTADPGRITTHCGHPWIEKLAAATRKASAGRFFT